MPVLDRKELEESPLSDLHAIASELGIEGYRLLRREKLIGAILGEEDRGPQTADGGDGDEERPARRRSRGGRGRSRGSDGEDRGPRTADRGSSGLGRH
jgi:transcription termination factor Rho